MAAREDFDDEQWRVLQLIPWQIGLGVMASAPSGILGRQRELRTVEARVRHAAEHGSESDLVRLIADEVVSGHEIPHAEPGGRSEEELADVVLERCAEVRALLDATVDANESRVFRRWLYDVAEHVAAASDEESLVGVGGERVSEQEVRYLGRLADALGIEPR